MDKVPSVFRLGRNAPSDELAAVRLFGRRRFSRSLIALGDLTAPLIEHTSVWVTGRPEISGVAVVFHGFKTAMLSVVADDASSGDALLTAARRELGGGGLLVANVEEPLLSRLEHEAADEDLWLTLETSAVEVEQPARLVRSLSEIAAFYDRCGVHFWAPAMTNFGHHYGVRDDDSVLISMAGVNFVIPEVGYAQIGNVATDEKWRNKGFATSCVRAVINGLHDSGVGRCGLFVNSGSPELIRLYQNIGFQEAGRFRFIPLAN